MNNTKNKITAVDLFCGAGGTSSGLVQACKEVGVNLELTAINHWDKAIETHSQNHPYARHLQETINSINPRKLFPNGLDFLWASPECTHHSIAAGGRPRCDQSRAGAWGVVDWVHALDPITFGIENVREFINWGPLDHKKHPIKSKKGETFKSWIRAIQSMGYEVNWQIVNCANYGDPTTRMRFFLIASKVGKIDFPEITHVKKGEMKFIPGQKDWIPAKNIIDWTIEGKSIFQRKKPLSKNTLNRIWKGIEKYCKDEFKPFLTMMYGSSDSVSIDNPLPTLTASGGNHYLAEPFLINICHTKVKHSAMVRSTNQPMPTQTTTEEFSICEPFIVKYYGNASTADTKNPLPTITTKDRFGVVQTYGFDIRFRMLKPHELSAGMSFPKNYTFTGNQAEKVKQIGNAVPVETSRKICSAMINKINELMEVPA
jgi:DNA (cytosine-5)-methyltransferase 1